MEIPNYLYFSNDNKMTNSVNFIATVNLFFPAVVYVKIIGMQLNPKVFIDTDGNTWNANELSDIKH